MVILKCKMCGGSLEIQKSANVAECDSCGTKQTLPKIEDERRSNLYDRANHFRRNNDFDNASEIFEKILDIDSTDPDIYWSLVLCRYGIEYVEETISHKRVPTVHRAQFTTVYEDADYKMALLYADEVQRELYETEAKTINDIQKGILSISQNEKPFDVFICYKETDTNGRRTKDSVIANDLYHQLTNEGFKVFFSRITLEDKLGVAYEPYIFAALNSSKVMVVLGSKKEYYNAVWVKNEWSRYLTLIKNGANKILIPAYKDMDPYDLPEEFSHLQAQDMSKLGFMQDLIKGIRKLTEVNTASTSQPVEYELPSQFANAISLTKRGFLFLEDEEFAQAHEYFNRALDCDPEYANAYIGGMLADFEVKDTDGLREKMMYIDENPNYKKAYKFSDEENKNMLEKLSHEIKTSIWNQYDQESKVLNEKIEVLKLKIEEVDNELIIKQNEYSDLKNNIQENKKLNRDKISKLDESIQKLHNEKSSLSILKFKEKKMLENKIEDLNSQILILIRKERSFETIKKENLNLIKKRMKELNALRDILIVEHSGHIAELGADCLS